MRAGNLRTLVNFQVKSISTDDEYGGQSETWTAVASNVRAEVIPLQGRELVTAQALHAETTIKATIRFRPGISAGNRMLIGSVVHDITAVINDRMRNRELTIYAKSGVSNG